MCMAKIRQAPTPPRFEVDIGVVETFFKDKMAPPRVTDPTAHPPFWVRQQKDVMEVPITEQEVKRTLLQAMEADSSPGQDRIRY